MKWFEYSEIDHIIFLKKKELCFLYYKLCRLTLAPNSIITS